MIFLALIIRCSEPSQHNEGRDIEPAESNASPQRETVLGDENQFVHAIIIVDVGASDRTSKEIRECRLEVRLREPI